MFAMDAKLQNLQMTHDKRIAKAIATRKRNYELKIHSTYLNRAWLFSRRCIDRMSLYDIAKLCRVEYDVIWEAIKECHIPLLLLVGREAWNDWVDKNKNLIPYKEKEWKKSSRLTV